MYCCLCRLCTVHAVGMPCGRRGRDRSWRRVISEKRAFPTSARRRPLRVPWIFVCENNQYATSLPIERTVAGSITARAAGFGYSGRQKSRNGSCGGVPRATCDAVARARGDGGPAFLEFTTHRFDVHHTFEFWADLRYRDAEEVSGWRARDPTAIRDVMKSERWPPGWQASGTPAPRRPLSASGTSEATAVPGRPGLRCSARRSSPRPQGRDSRAGGE